MGFPSIDLTVIKAQLKQAFDAQGHEATVTLREGSSFTVRVTEGFRSAQDLTDGIMQEVHRFKVLYDDWESASPGRAPNKGDQLTVLGQRYAISNRVRLRALNGVGILYVMEAAG